MRLGQKEFNALEIVAELLNQNHDTISDIFKFVVNANFQNNLFFLLANK